MLTDFTKTIYEVQFIPFWQDNCNHGESAYIFSFVNNYFSHSQNKWIKEKLDVYTFESPTLGQEWCLRFSNVSSDYYSPTNTSNLMEIDHEPYTICVKILKELGRFRWLKNE